MNRRAFFTAAVGGAVAAVASTRAKEAAPTFPSVDVKMRSLTHVNMFPVVTGRTFTVCENGVPVEYVLQYWNGVQ